MVLVGMLCSFSWSSRLGTLCLARSMTPESRTAGGTMQRFPLWPLQLRWQLQVFSWWGGQRWLWADCILASAAIHESHHSTLVKSVPSWRELEVLHVSHGDLETSKSDAPGAYVQTLCCTGEAWWCHYCARVLLQGDIFTVWVAASGAIQCLVRKLRVFMIVQCLIQCLIKCHSCISCRKMIGTHTTLSSRLAKWADLHLFFLVALSVPTEPLDRFQVPSSKLRDLPSGDAPESSKRWSKGTD